ncbi:MAG: hypothetical protein HUU28_04250 [Planctomycetaceae bacterium]|nr:hypothetical protein [Planctomycetaceae bacterium]
MFRTIRPPALRRAAWTALASAALVPSVWCQSPLEPLGTEFLVNASTNYNQYWPRVDFAPDGSRITFSFVSGQDPFARHFSPSGTPLTGNLTCNPTLNVHVQDESEIACSTDGRQLVAWSERHGYDGEIMGIFGRIFLPNGSPLGPEFQINEIWQASQWRPLIARHPDGGWVVAWSGDWDGDAMIRVVNSDGTFRTPDIRVNTFDNGAQVDPCAAVAPDGTIFVAFVDFSGYAGIGSGTNLWGRTFDSSGAPLQPAPFPLNSSGYTATDQREPRVICDSQGRFLVVWEDQSKDGGGYGVFGRRFSTQGTPLGPEFQINLNSAGSQRNPKAAVDSAGNVVVAWEDRSTGDADVWLQYYDPSDNRVGPPLQVNTAMAGDQKSVGIAIAPDGERVVVTFEGPGVSTDVYARLYERYEGPGTYCTAKVNSLGCSPTIGWTGTPSLSGPDDFHVTAGNVLNQKNGLLFWGLGGGALPYYGGTLCVQPPVFRTPAQQSNGNTSSSDCSGAYDFAFSQAYMASKGLQAGTKVFTQFWSRDPGFPGSSSIGLTNGLSFELRP